MDRGIQAQMLPGFGPSSWQVHVSPQGPHKHHFRASCLSLGSSCLDFYSHACPFSAELSPSHHNPLFSRSLRLAPYLFLFPSFRPPLLLFLAISHQPWNRSPMPGVFPPRHPPTPPP